MTDRLYAVIDGAAEKELLPMLAKLDPPVSCLYAEPVQDELVEIAPYLVQVTDEVKQWLTTRDSYWGFYLTSSARMKDIRHHLRKHLQAMIDGEEKPVFFRFYDPRNIWKLCDLLSDWQLYHFLGPITAITTDIDGVVLSNDFKSRREQFPHDVISRKKMLTFDMAQVNTFERHLEEIYIRKLTNVISSWHNKETVDYPTFARDVFYYLQSIDITDDRTIRGLCKLFLTQGYHTLAAISNELKTRLETTTQPAQVSAELLLIEQLGSVPLLDK